MTRPKPTPTPTSVPHHAHAGAPQLHAPSSVRSGLAAAGSRREQWRLARERFFQLHKHRNEPLWMRCMLTAACGLAYPLIGMGLHWAFAAGGHTPGLWDVLASLLLGQCIAFTISAAYRLIERRCSEAQLMALNQGGWRAGLLFTGVPALAIIGWISAANLLLQWSLNVRIENAPLNSWSAFSQFLAFLCVFSVAGWYVSRQRWKAQTLQLLATEAQLLRLQAQMEPHFLFNSLAAVQSLIRVDPQRAEDMLEHFTDYLRSSLHALRAGEQPLSSELEVVSSYLALMRIRMGERLRIAIDVPDALRHLHLPPLLLQPLVENAIVHGLEPSTRGGEVRVSAHLDGQRLTLEVMDNGLGLRAPQRPGRSQGVALNNIRERLAQRYGGNASLTVHRTEHGCTSRLVLPVLNPVDQEGL